MVVLMNLQLSCEGLTGRTYHIHEKRKKETDRVPNIGATPIGANFGQKA